jgi:hypothetical protein
MEAHERNAGMSAAGKCGWTSQPSRVAILLYCALTAITARAATAETQENTPAAATQWNSHFAIGDFDGDSQPDLATVQSGPDRSDTRYWIRLEFSTGLRDDIGLIAPSGGLHITSRDVNGDHFLDLVVSTAWQHHPVAVLLNDGHGKFTVRDPAQFPRAVLDCDLSWAPACSDIKDAAAAILTRSLSGACDVDGLAASAHSFRELLVPEDSPDFLCSANGSLFGRAPPCISHL